MMRYAFESDEAQQLNQDIFETVYYSAVKASCELARHCGPYDTYEGSPVSHGVSCGTLLGFKILMICIYAVAVDLFYFCLTSLCY